MSLLDKVKLAVDADPMFEDEIRSLINQSPRMEKDFERVKVFGGLNTPVIYADCVQ